MATGTSKKIAIHKAMGTGFTTLNNAYAIITDLATGDMMHASTGVVDTDYGDCDIAFADHDYNTDWAIATIPGLDTSKRYAITIYENATPTAGDTAVVGPLMYDPDTGVTYTDTNPIVGNKIRSRRD